jgi:isocitrate/isopropylmalate dehydrogenase
MAGQREFKIGVLAGDGIGPEITDATIEVLHAASERTGLKLRLMYRLVGWKAREQEGTLLSEVGGHRTDAAGFRRLDHGADLRW